MPTNLTMPRLYLFNPENDLALALDKAQYTAPPNAQLLHNAGALLPIWFCKNEDQIIANSNQLNWLDQQKKLFNVGGSISTLNSISEISLCTPWGWSYNARKQFLDFGINQNILPNNDQLNKIRELSHRRISIEINTQINELLALPHSTNPIEATNEEMVADYLHKHQTIFLKSPWSSSGRGIVNSSKLTKNELIRRAKGIINRQGAVMCEKALNKVHDFAVLFYSNGKQVKYQGLSSFFNSDAGAYSGNIIGTQEFISKTITKYINPDTLNQLTYELSKILTSIIAPHYSGYLGVDMMIYNHNGEYLIAPCIELNLRMTMGIVAMLWSNNHLAQGSHGVMKVEYSPLSSHTKTTTKEALILDKKLKSGTISLIPPDNHFKIYIEVSNYYSN